MISSGGFSYGVLEFRHNLYDDSGLGKINR